MTTQWGKQKKNHALHIRTHVIAVPLQELSSTVVAINRNRVVRMKLRYHYKNSKLLLSQLTTTGFEEERPQVRNYTKCVADSHAHGLQQSVETKRASTKNRLLSARQIINNTTTRSIIIASKCAVLRREKKRGFGINKKCLQIQARGIPTLRNKKGHTQQKNMWTYETNSMNLLQMN